MNSARPIGPLAPQARICSVADWPAPAARAKLAELLARYPGEHLLRATLLARAAALDETRSEWQAALAQGQREAAELLERY